MKIQNHIGDKRERKEQIEHYKKLKKSIKSKYKVALAKQNFEEQIKKEFGDNISEKQIKEISKSCIRTAEEALENKLLEINGLDLRIK